MLNKVPALSDIAGNEKADKAAKEATSMELIYYKQYFLHTDYNLSIWRVRSSKW